MFVKICGLTAPETAETAVGLGADAIGMVMSRTSVRRIDPGTVASIVEALHGSIEVTETPTFPVHVRTADGAQLEWSATTHYLSGYRRKDAAMSARLVDHLVAHPEARGLLAQPVALLDRLAHVLRQPPPAAP